LSMLPLYNATYFWGLPVRVNTKTIRDRDWPHFHKHIQICFVLSGELKHRINGTDYVQRAGSCSFVLPYTAHTLDSRDSDDTPVIFYAWFDENFLTERGYDLYSYGSGIAHFEGFEIPEFCELNDGHRAIDIVACKPVEPVGHREAVVAGESVLAHRHTVNVYGVDGMTAAIGTGVLAEYALELADEGMDAKDIAQQLEIVKAKVRIVGMIDTLEFLQRGGRISKTVAIAGGMLSIKPLISVQDGVINMIAKARGLKQGCKQIGVEAEKMGEVDFEKPVILGFTGVSSENLDKFEEAYGGAWEKEGNEYGKAAIGSVIGTHIGPGAFAVAFFLK